MIRNLIWDVDGTLFDTYPAITQAFLAALGDLGKTAEPGYVEGLARQSLSHCATVLTREKEVDEEALGERFLEHYEAMPLAQQGPFPGVIEVCRHIVAIGGTNTIVTHRGAGSTAQLLQLHQLEPYFAEVITRDDGYPRKPSPLAFQALIQGHNFKLDETLAIGDRDIDILAGRAAGVKTCLFTEEEANVIPDLIIHDFMQLHALLAAEEV